MWKKVVLGCVGLAVLVVSPIYFLAGPHFEFGADDLRAAVEGTWELRVPAKPPGGDPRTLTFALTQSDEPEQHSSRRALVPSAHACGSRSLVRNAGACMDETTMPVVVTLVAGAAPQQPAQGTFRVFGLAFKSGELQLVLDDTLVTARLSPTGAASEVTMGGQPATLVRVSTATR